MAGVFIPVDKSNINPSFSGAILTPVSALIPIGTTGQYGVLLNGFSLGDKFGVTDPIMIGNSVPSKVQLGVITPDETGKLKINTTLIPNSISNSSQSIVVADFNKDSVPDIFLAAHNEAPFVATSSTVYMSKSDGTYNKVVLNDKSLAHDAKLVIINGEPAIKASVYGGEFQPIYKYTSDNYLSISLTHWFTKNNDTSNVNIYLDGKKVKTVSFNSNAGTADANGAWSIGQGVAIPIADSSIKHVITFDIDNLLNSGFASITDIRYNDIRIDPSTASHSIPDPWPGFKQNWLAKGVMTYELPSINNINKGPSWKWILESNPGFFENFSAGKVISKINYFSGASSVIDNFGKNGDSQIVYSDVILYDNNWKPLNSSIYVFPFDGKVASSTKPIQIITPYLSTLPEYKNTVSLNGIGQSHVDRLWSIDLNKDTKPDILAAQSMWGPNTFTFPSALQVLINNTDGKFTDMTNILNPDLNLNINILDYSPSFIDIDNSGIETLLLAGNFWVSDANLQANTILINDGTGRLYVALHDQFKSLSVQVNDFVTAQGYYSLNFVPRFIAVPQRDGSIDFLAQVQIIENENINGQQVPHSKYAMVNLPMHYNPLTDFTTNVTISDRNSSMLMRTWAGNDRFFDKNANTSPAHIDGGLGSDIAIYSGLRSDYLVKFIESNNFQIKLNAKNQTLPLVEDTLVNVERLQFTDKSIALDLSGSAGTTAKILGAVFGKESLSNKNYVGIGLSFLDSGWTYDNLADLALDAAGAKTNDQIVSLLWSNVIGTKPTAADKQPFIALLENGMSAGALAHLAADSSFNITNINLVGLVQTGIEYIPVD